MHNIITDNSCITNDSYYIVTTIILLLLIDSSHAIASDRLCFVADLKHESCYSSV